MSRRRTLTAAAVLGFVMIGTGPVAHAAPDTEPCGPQEAKVAKAEDALERVTAVFARQKDKVADAEAALAAAETDKEKAKAEKRLAKAQEKAAEVKKEKKAQKQRLAKAQQRLDDCLAEQA